MYDHWGSHSVLATAANVDSCFGHKDENELKWWRRRRDAPSSLIRRDRLGSSSKNLIISCVLNDREVL